MVSRKYEDALETGGIPLLVFIFRFILVVLIFHKIAVFIKLVVVLAVFLVVLVFVIFFVYVIGNGVQRHGMRLRNFQFALALRAAQDFSLFHFVFVHIDFSGTFRAAEHVSILRFDFQPVQLEISGPTNRRIIYPAREPSVEAHSPAIQCNSTASMKE
jgi:hypothetical protein